MSAAVLLATQSHLQPHGDGWSAAALVELLASQAPALTHKFGSIRANWKQIANDKDPCVASHSNVIIIMQHTNTGPSISPAGCCDSKSLQAATAIRSMQQAHSQSCSRTNNAISVHCDLPRISYYPHGKNHCTWDSKACTALGCIIDKAQSRSDKTCRPGLEVGAEELTWRYEGTLAALAGSADSSSSKASSSPIKSSSSTSSGSA